MPARNHSGTSFPNRIEIIDMRDFSACACVTPLARAAASIPFDNTQGTRRGTQPCVAGREGRKRDSHLPLFRTSTPTTVEQRFTRGRKPVVERHPRLIPSSHLFPPRTTTVVKARGLLVRDRRR